MNKISLLGDLAFNGLLSNEPDINPFRFAAVSNILAQADLIFANLEVPVKASEEKNEYKKLIYYSLSDPTRGLLKQLNIGCVSLANNHVYDCKMSGLKATISLLDELGIYHTGAGWKPNHIEPAIIKKDGYSIAFLAYVDRSTNPKTEYFPELLINYFDPEIVKKDINAVKLKVSKIICSIHWGVDYSYYPTPQQIKIAHELIDAGADIIMGHHPHTLQPYEKYKNGYIFYSLGGLTFGDYKKEEKSFPQALYVKTKKSIIAEISLRERTVHYTSTLEKKSNFIIITSRNFERWSKREWLLYSIKYSSKLTIKLFNFKEKVVDRVYEYFFGYYKSPVKRLFQFKNFKKINRLFTK